MRISNELMFAEQQQGIDQDQQQVQTLTNQASSGTQLVQPGDDPAGAAEVVQQRLALLGQAAIGTAATQATDELQTASSALTSLSNILSQAQQLAVQFSNGSNNAADLQDGAAQVGGLIQSAVQLLNSQYGSRYIFGGTADSSPPFDATGAYLGNDQVRTLQLGNGLSQTVSVQAGAAIAGIGGGINVMATLQSLQTALSSGSTSAVTATLTGLTQSITQVTTANAQAGTDLDSLQAASSLASSQQTQGTQTISQIEDADVFTTATQLSMAQEGLQAAIAATSSSSQMSLLQMLK